MTDRSSSRALRVLLPLLVLALGVAALALLVVFRRRPAPRPPEIPVPVVETVPVHYRPERVTVHAEGAVEAETRTTLVAEVGGRILHVSPRFEDGAFVRAGDLLLEIDPVDWKAALETARATLARAELALVQEKAAAEQARRDWERFGTGDPDPLVLHEPQLARARAEVEAARAGVARAERDLDRTRVRAPYDGRVISRNVDVGQVVMPGTALGTLFATDAVLVPLPVPDDELAFLDVPLRPGDPPGPRVTLRTRFGGAARSWRGRIVRTGGQVDPRSRMVRLVARVSGPFTPGRPPLVPGMFVRAEIPGRSFPRAARLPRVALRGGDTVLAVDGESRVRIRHVRVLRRERDTVLVGEGLSEGERVVVTPLEIATDGMRVEVAGTDGDRGR